MSNSIFNSKSNSKSNSNSNSNTNSMVRDSLYLCALGHVYNFSHWSVTLNIAGNDAVQKSASDIRRGYKRLFIEESDSEWSQNVLNVLIF